MVEGSMLTPDMVIAFHRDAFNGALLRADYAALRLVYDDSYMLVRPSGQVLSKEEVLEDLEKASLSFLSISLEGTDVRIYGTTAVLTAESDIHTRRGENDVHARVRLVAIYVARETALQLVHFQSTALPVVNP
jgi:MoaA/NifB/PqqE/SkfB family radical SAM enzyme